MKLKYKKTIVVITMCTMCIGLVTLSVTSPKVKSSTEVEATPAPEGATGKEETVPVDVVSGEQPSPTPVVSDINLEWETKPEITELVRQYFDASVKVDMDALTELVSDISHVDEELLRLKYEYVDEYQNIECYTAAAPNPGCYVVYVVSDLKIRDIDTTAPGLTSIYVSTREDGSLCVYLGVLDEATQNYIASADQSVKVKGLIDTVEKNLQEKVTADEKLKQFYENLQNQISE